MEFLEIRDMPIEKVKEKWERGLMGNDLYPFLYLCYFLSLWFAL